MEEIEEFVWVGGLIGERLAESGVEGLLRGFGSDGGIGEVGDVVDDHVDDAVTEAAHILRGELEGVRGLHISMMPIDAVGGVC